MMQTKEEIENLKNHLKQLSLFPSWKIIQQELEKEVYHIEQSLFDTRSSDSLQSINIKRAERKIFKLLIELPETMFQELSNISEQLEEEA